MVSIWRLDATYIEVRGHSKHLYNIVEHDHRFVNRKMRAALSFKGFHSDHGTMQGVEVVRMILKGLVVVELMEVFTTPVEDQH